MAANQVIEIQPWDAEPVTAEPVTAEDEEFRHKHCGVWASFEGQTSTLLARTLNVPTHTIGSRVSVHDLVLCDENRNPITNEVLAGLERATLYVWRKDELGIEEDASEQPTHHSMPALRPLDEHLSASAEAG